MKIREVFAAGEKHGPTRCNLTGSVINCIIDKYRIGDKDMIEKKAVIFPAFTGEEERTAYIYLPPMAQACPELRFPVLYMFDGHNVFFDEDATYGKSWGMGEFLDYCDIPLIVAALECHHGENGARIHEYAPYSVDVPRHGHFQGCGRETMDWFVGVFKPMVDAYCPTLPDRKHTFIAGSSMGGLMSLFALAEYNDVFSRAAALSPSIGFAPSRCDEMIRNARFAPDTVLYMDMGEKELKSYRAAAPRWRGFCRLLQDKGVLLTSRIVPEGEHNEASWEKQNPFFISTLLYGLED